MVTGGAGFIGSHLVERLLKDGHEVLCLDNFDAYYDPQIKKENVAPFTSNKNFTLLVGDILDRDLLKEYLEDVDFIFHEAAQAGVRISVENPIKPHEVNASGTLNLLEAALDTDVKKIIYASSSSVYGKAKYLPLNEEHPNLPVSPYGISKLMAEHYCRVFDEIYGLKTISLRYFTVYGPRMRPDLAISIFTRRALQNDKIEIFGTGEKTRDFTYIDDVVEANMLAMNSGRGEYNIGSGLKINIRELAERIIRYTGSLSEVRYSEDKIGDAEYTWADITKAKKELGWVPNFKIEHDIGRYIDWYKAKGSNHFMKGLYK